VEKVSVLISGKDTAYNEALAAALSEYEKNYFVTCASPERLLVEAAELSDKYDVFLLDKEPAAIKLGDTPKLIIMQEEETPNRRNEAGHLGIFKYRGVKHIAGAIYREYKGKSSPYNEGEEVSKAYIPSAEGNFKSITIVGDADEETCMGAGSLISRSLAMMGKKVLFFDLQEFPARSGFSEERTGERSWDDFIYCCIYGKTDDMLREPSKFCGVDASGVCYFSGKKGKNPFRSLDEDEVSMFYEGLREKCCMDFGLGIISDVGRWLSMTCLRESDLVVVLSDGSENDRERCEEIIQKLTDEEGFKGKTMTICLGAKWDMGEFCDFSVEYNDDVRAAEFRDLLQMRAWKDISRVAGYIADGCFV